MRQRYPSVVSLEGSTKNAEGFYSPELARVWNEAQVCVDKEYGGDSIESLAVFAFYKLMHRKAKQGVKFNTLNIESISEASFRREIEKCLGVDGWEAEYEKYKKANQSPGPVSGVVS